MLEFLSTAFFFVIRLIAYYLLYFILTLIALAVALGGTTDSVWAGLIGLFLPPILAFVHARRSLRRRKIHRSGNKVKEAEIRTQSRAVSFGQRKQTPSITKDERTKHSTTEAGKGLSVPHHVADPSDSRLSVTRAETYSKYPASSHNAERGWIPKHRPASVRGWEIGGMVYVGTPPRAGRNGGKCRAYIDPALPIGREPADKEGKGLDYWPNYSSIPPVSRATYLKWLADGRNDPAFNVGYMFLYFYGLERRFLVENPESDEKQEILDEAERLSQLYQDNYSAQKYLQDFIEFGKVVSNSPALRNPTFNNRGYELPASLKVAVGAIVAGSGKLDADWTLSWWYCHPESNVRTAAQRCEQEFRTLFRRKFQNRYPDGMKVRVPKKTLSLHYRAASGEFERTYTPRFKNDALPDISLLKRPVSAAQEIADEAMSELAKYSRFVGKNPEKRGTIEAFALLPKELRSTHRSGDVEALTAWLWGIVNAGGKVVAADLVERLENDRPDKISKRQLVDVEDALASLGFGIAPDSRYSLRTPKIDEPMILFQLPSEEIVRNEVSEAYRDGLLQVALGVFVAQADNKVDVSEKKSLLELVKGLPGLNARERLRMVANLMWLLAVPPDFALFRSKLKSASSENQRAIRNFVVSMVHADSVVHADEVRRVESIYRALGLPTQSVYSDLHARGGSDEPVVVQRAVAALPGDQIPEESSGNGLDAARIAAIRSDTSRVSAVLGAIFADGEEEAASENLETENDAGMGKTRRFDGLDVGHAAFVDELIQRVHWSEGEFAELAKRHNLLAAGCLETINEWAFERYDDALVEEYDGLELNKDIIRLLDGQIGGAV